MCVYKRGEEHGDQGICHYSFHLPYPHPLHFPKPKQCSSNAIAQNFSQLRGHESAIETLTKAKPKIKPEPKSTINSPKTEQQSFIITTETKPQIPIKQTLLETIEISQKILPGVLAGI